jgi:uncharacterized LabA/DUF88 family protein
MAPLPPTAYMYIDAAYVAEQLKHEAMSPFYDATGNGPVWFDLKQIVDLPNFSTRSNLPFAVQRLFFYDALLPESSPAIQRENQQSYLQLIESMLSVDVRTGFIRPGRKRRQKGVDIQLAVDALVAATNRLAEGIILVSGDADFAPLGDEIRRTGTFFFVAGFKDSLSTELLHSADGGMYLPEPSKWTKPDWFTPKQ